MIIALILAAGESARMGQPKQLLRFEGRSLLRHAVETVAQSECQGVIVVIGANAEAMRAELAGSGATLALNADWRAGMGTSLRAGLDALPDDADAVLVMTCDQPLVTPALLNELIAQWRQGDAPIAACEYGGGAGVPALFARALFADLRALPNSSGAKPLLHQRAADVARVPFPAGALDLDTPEDYARLADQGAQPKAEILPEKLHCSGNLMQSNDDAV